MKPGFQSATYILYLLFNTTKQLAQPSTFLFWNCQKILHISNSKKIQILLWPNNISIPTCRHPSCLQAYSLSHIDIQGSPVQWRLWRQNVQKSKSKFVPENNPLYLPPITPLGPQTPITPYNQIKFTTLIWFKNRIYLNSSQCL